MPYKDKKKKNAASKRYRIQSILNHIDDDEDDVLPEKRCFIIPDEKELWKRCLERRRRRFEDDSDYNEQLDELGLSRG